MINSDSTSQIVRCPYMPEHVMHPNSLGKHLDRCKATNKHLFKTCPYNYLHVIPKQKYNDHLQRCQNQHTISCISQSQRQHYDQQQSWEQSKKSSYNPRSYIDRSYSSKSSSSSSCTDSDFYSSSAQNRYGYYEYYNNDNNNFYYNQYELYDYQYGSSRPQYQNYGESYSGFMKQKNNRRDDEEYKLKQVQGELRQIPNKKCQQFKYKYSNKHSRKWQSQQMKKLKKDEEKKKQQSAKLKQQNISSNQMSQSDKDTNEQSRDLIKKMKNIQISKELKILEEDQDLKLFIDQLNYSRLDQSVSSHDELGNQLIKIRYFPNELQNHIDLNKSFF